MKFRHYIYVFMAMVLGEALIASCSTTSAIPEGEQLFTGLKKITYVNYETNDHATSTQEEMEYVLASAPNGALFGSSYYRTPFPVRLWVWNAFSQSDNGMGKWIAKTFGSRPKLVGEVRPELRTSIAESQLKKSGYFNGKVNYEILTGHNPKKAKIAYTVDMGHLWTLDTVVYENFPSATDSLMTHTHANALLHKGDPFSVSTLESERRRITKLFRGDGYYYYNNSYASYLADTVNVPGKVALRLIMADSLSPRATHKWYIGNININFRKQIMEELGDSTRWHFLTVRYNGRRPPIRLGAILRDVKLHHGMPYSSDKEEQSRRSIQSMGLFSYNTLTFTPRDTSATCDSLDLTLDLVFDRPYDFYVEANAKGKTSGRMGPEMVLGLTKRNAFHGGEKLDVNVHGQYEWQTGHKSEGSSSGFNSYEYGADASVVMPRLLTPRSLFYTIVGREARPRRRPRQYYSTPTTTLKASTNVLNRADYFKRHVVSGELTYDWWTTASSHHTFSPLTLSYEYMQSKTAAFDSLLLANPYLQISMRDQFIPKMSYTYHYISPSELRNPITWEISVSEAGNAVSGIYAAFGEKWSRKNKTMFKNPFAQFFKVETDFVKRWRLSEHSSFLAHANVGVVWSYGNASQAPYYEQFYVGGANSVRAFNVRSIGPGKYVPSEGRFSYIDQTGDVKVLTNLEYRPRLFGDLYGALFLDAGNVWTLHQDDNRQGGQFEFKNFFRQMAVGTGVGIRYDMGMFVIRLDWGVGLHVPYETGRSSFYNVKNFHDAQSIHLAVGYPF
ncbi:translocation and assembly module lipoprotein TamL [Segatella buccae]|uniref:translocation and assembly module lipoprotein TamL n=1 Tax=Segatella buccae TaxID=28126 RepID=UPI0027B98638|nr:BamA/TamA family outer membrane protein [Segatella buccae]